MMTVNEVSKLTGVSIRTLQYYDNIGLLRPAMHTDSGYRMYDDSDMERLQQILLFRELELPLKDIKRIIGSSDFDRKGVWNSNPKKQNAKNRFCRYLRREDNRIRR